jgi:hypothetical protein
VKPSNSTKTQPIATACLCNDNHDCMDDISPTACSAICITSSHPIVDVQSLLLHQRETLSEDRLHLVTYKERSLLDVVSITLGNNTAMVKLPPDFFAEMHHGIRGTILVETAREPATLDFDFTSTRRSTTTAVPTIMGVNQRMWFFCAGLIGSSALFVIVVYVCSSGGTHPCCCKREAHPYEGSDGDGMNEDADERSSCSEESYDSWIGSQIYKKRSLSSDYERRCFYERSSIFHNGMPSDDDSALREYRANTY